jgi:2-methylcitrate synthase
VHGKLPNEAELAAYKHQAQAPARPAGRSCQDALEQLPANAHPMDVMRTGCSVSALGFPSAKGRSQPAGARDIADRLMASWVRCCCTGTTYTRNGKRIDVETDDDTIGGTSCTCCMACRRPSRWVRAAHSR